ncbi:hypothetical protein DFH09DRAFT_503650 [Mycena vulgaris]|nr:hypothetical protein DFH09DRAFT_503650 [Mycena vulgaris]
MAWNHSNFSILPTDLLLTIFDFLCEPSLSPIRCKEEQKSPTSYSIRHVRALSLASRRLHQLCLPFLFSSLTFIDAQEQELQLLEAKCRENPSFAGLIRKLDLSDLTSPDIPPFLLSLLPRLKSLQWLDLDVDHVGADLLVTVNSHPSLRTVAVCDTHLAILTSLVSATPLSFSKILINSAMLGCNLALQLPALRSLMSRGPRMPHLILRDESAIKHVTDTLLPGVETLDIRVCTHRTSPMFWLPNFVERHEHLNTITFTGDQDGDSWSQNPDILFPGLFMEALERDALGRTVTLHSFSISRAGSSSLNSWQVTKVEMTIAKPGGVSALRIISTLAPHLSTLAIEMSRCGRRPIRIDDLVSALSCFPSLRRLELRYIYRHLLFKGQAPWALSASEPGRETSNGMAAHAALQWITAHVAQRVLTLDLIHMVDDGSDGTGRLRHPWRLEATYQVQRNPGITFQGTPEFVMADWFRLPPQSEHLLDPC